LAFSQPTDAGAIDRRGLDAAPMSSFSPLGLKTRILTCSAMARPAARSGECASLTALGGLLRSANLL